MEIRGIHEENECFFGVKNLGINDPRTNATQEFPMTATGAYISSCFP